MGAYHVRVSSESLPADSRWSLQRYMRLHSLWQTRGEVYLRALFMVDKSLGVFAAKLHAPEAVHFVVNAVELIRLLACMSETCRAFSGLDRRNIDKVRRPEVRGLHPCHHLEVIKRKSPSHSQPGIVDQQRVGPMILVRVNGPVRKNRVRLLCFQNCPELIVAIIVYFDSPIHLAGECRAGFQDFTSLLRLCLSDDSGLLIGLAFNAPLSPGKIEDHYFVLEISEPGDRSSAPGFRIVGVGSRHDNLWFRLAT